MDRLLPHQDASYEELFYARLDGKHTAMESGKKAEDFVYRYTTKLAPNKIIAREFMEGYKSQILLDRQVHDAYDVGRSNH
jgi:hypothetical protein